MSGLSGSRWASKASGESASKDTKPKDETKHISVPSFGFQMPVFTPTKPSPLRRTQAPRPAQIEQPAIRPTLAPQTEPSPATSTTETAVNKPEQVLKKVHPKAEKAAAATRARMAEIMGPRRRQGPVSAVKGTGPANHVPSKQAVKEEIGGGEEGGDNASKLKNEEVVDLLA